MALRQGGLDLPQARLVEPLHGASTAGCPLGLPLGVRPLALLRHHDHQTDRILVQRQVERGCAAELPVGVHGDPGEGLQRGMLGPEDQAVVAPGGAGGDLGALHHHHLGAALGQPGSDPAAQDAAPHHHDVRMRLHPIQVCNLSLAERG